MNAHFPTCEEILEKLVSFETVNGDELPCAQWIAGLLEALGMQVTLQQAAPGRANVFARVGEGSAVLLCGHLDVVPAQGAWGTPPFVMTKKDGLYYGRGCADMKGAIAAMISAAHTFMSSGEEIKHGFALLFVADEEKGNIGALRFLQAAPQDIKHCVIGEPTMLQLAIAHKGAARIRVTAHGRSAHSSIAHEGINAIQGAALLVGAIKEEDRRLNRITHPILPPPSMNVTVLHAGEQDNIIPGRADMVLDCRVMPGTTYEQALGDVQRIADGVTAAHPLFTYTVSPYAFLAGGEIAPDDPFALRCANIVEETLGGVRTMREFRATCEQSLFLAAGIPTLICGPGDISQAHTVDEYLPEAQLADAQALYGAFIRAFNRG